MPYRSLIASIFNVSVTGKLTHKDLIVSIAPDGAKSEGVHRRARVHAICPGRVRAGDHHRKSRGEDVHEADGAGGSDAEEAAGDLEDGK